MGQTQRQDDIMRVTARRQASEKERGLMIYITGDTHSSFERIERFCDRFETSREEERVSGVAAECQRGVK